ncbi:MAG: ABC transporter permease [Oscillospiraceae bacterium]|jgi:putative ABC transport system permease protein|nr:ABC transporter permease [Oscillospiraceae bacterium]
MRFFESFELALKNILAGKMRAFLTMLGIIIGVMSVITIVGLGNGMENYMVDAFKSLGTDTLNIMITGRGSSRSVSEEKMYEIVEEHPEYFLKLSPMVSMGGVTVKLGSETLESPSVTGVSEDYLEMKQYLLMPGGRGLYYVDVRERANVCVVGTYVSETYFNGDAVGETLKISGRMFTIIGVMDIIADSGETEEGGADDVIFIPYSTAARMSGIGVLNSYTVTLVSEDLATPAKAAMEDELYDIFGSDNAYRVQSMSELLGTMTQMLSILITVLALIAGISLLVGGIGIMNIMLVSVTERTREIGIRKALGAKERYIMSQFVIEAATTSVIGGALGILAGFGLSAVATQVIAAMTEESLTVSPSIASVFMAFGISAVIGILFGYLPAKKAAKLNPIDALRYE